MRTRRLESELVPQRVQEVVRHLLPDAHGAVALHVAVAAHRTRTRAGPAEIAAQQKEVDDLPDGGHSVLVLGDAHRPADDDPFAAQHVVTDRLDLRAGQPGRGEHVLPADLPGVLGELLEAAGVALDELAGEHLTGPRVLGLQEKPVEPLEEGEVAAGADVQEPVGDLDSLADDPARLLRVLEPHEPRLGQRVHRDDAGSVQLRLLQRRELAGVVGARVLAHQEDQIGVVQIFQADRALPGAQRLVEREAARFVAHVGAVRQVVGPEGTREELEHEGGLVADPARGVEGGLVGRGERLQLIGEQVQGVAPADRLVVVGAGALDHRLGEPALLVEPEVGAARQLGDRVLTEELRGDPAGGRLVVDVLGAVLAVLVAVPVAGGGVRPRAAGAVDAAHLVHGQQIDRCLPGRGLLQGVLQRVHHRRDARGPGLGRGDGQVFLRLFAGRFLHRFASRRLWWRAGVSPWARWAWGSWPPRACRAGRARRGWCRASPRWPRRAPRRNP